MMIAINQYWGMRQYLISDDDHYLDHMTPRQSFSRHLGMIIQFKKDPLITTRGRLNETLSHTKQKHYGV